ncbi:MAG TPA: septation protein SepH [Streptosporangiaceae bacterium]|nr:septation protein SepH [Streptosporangiaceae bacterium]
MRRCPSFAWAGEQVCADTPLSDSAKGALMQELRLVAVSEDGSYAVLVVPGRSGRFALPIDERLRTVARGQFSRLAQYEIEVESPLRPKEIQDRIRAGETAEEIADAAGLPVDRIRRFEGPVLAEREYQAAQAQRATVRAPGESGPGQRLGDVLPQRLSDLGASSDDQDWDSRKRHDGNWQVQLAYTVAGRMYVAEWIYDPRSKHVTPADDEAVRLSLDEGHWPAPRSSGSGAKATVTPIGSRLAVHHPSEHRPEHRGDAERHTMQHPSLAAPTTVPSQPVKPEPASPEAPAAAAGQAASEPSEPRVAQEPAPPAASQAKERESEQPPRPARRAGGSRSRRSSVPSWDEIMFGNSRQPE